MSAKINKKLFLIVQLRIFNILLVQKIEILRPALSEPRFLPPSVIHPTKQGRFVGTPSHTRTYYLYIKTL